MTKQRTIGILVAKFIDSGCRPIDRERLQEILDKERAMRATSQPQATFDVRMLPGGGKDRLHGLDDTAAAIISSAAVDVLAEHPSASRRDVPGLAHSVWQRTRSIPAGGSGRTVQDAMVIARIQPIYELELVLAMLLAQGGVKRTLQAARDEIDAQLRRLEGVPAR